MHARYSWLILPTLAAGLAFAAPSPARAWPTSPAAGLPVCTEAATQQNPVACSDGAGGMIVAWEDARTGNWNIYAQRIDAQGTMLWTAGGVGVCTDPLSQSSPSIIPSGAGGAIVAWRDSRGGIAGGTSLYAQRLDGQGNGLWPTGGVQLAPGTCYVPGGPAAPRLAPDGAGGALLAWSDLRPAMNPSSYLSIFAQRVDSMGVAAWAMNGVCLGAYNFSYGPAIASDGSGGAYVAYHTYNSGITNYNVCLWHLTLGGSVAWGVYPNSNPSVRSAWPELLPDGTGGVFVMWTTSGSLLGAQHVDAQRRLLWSYGTWVCSAGGADQGFRMAPNGAGGFFAAWPDRRTGPSQIYAQNMSASGQALWSSYGLAVSTGSADKAQPAITYDGSNGAIVAWNDRRAGSCDIYAQRLNIGGQAVWPSNGALVCNALLDQVYPTLVSDGHGQPRLAWQDMRNGTWDIYAQSFEARPVIAGARDIPNDQGGKLRLAWNPSYFDTDPTTAVDTYRLWRQLPAAAVSESLQSALASPGGGVIDPPEDALFRASDFAGQIYYWEFLAAVPAAGREGYSYLVATTGDSIPGSNPYTLFLVEARSTLTGQHWDSDPDSGYSVDNLPPARPSAFVADYMQNQVALRWSASPEADLASYRLYRGNDEGFVPGPENCIATLVGTEYKDQVDRPKFAVYKLAAVDLHGNQSPYACISIEGPTPVLVALVSATCEENAAEITWMTTAGPGQPATVQRRCEGEAWRETAIIRAEASGLLRFTDTGLEPGLRYGYRLGMVGETGPGYYGEAWVTAPPPVLALAGARPNPAVGGRLAARFTLPTAAPARLTLFSVSGRRIVAREVGSLGPGTHTLDLAGGRRLAAGMYVLRLEQDGRALVQRAVVLP